MEENDPLIGDIINESLNLDSYIAVLLQVIKEFISKYTKSFPTPLDPQFIQSFSQHLTKTAGFNDQTILLQIGITIQRYIISGEWIRSTIKSILDFWLRKIKKIDQIDQILQNSQTILSQIQSFYQIILTDLQNLISKSSLHSSLFLPKIQKLTPIFKQILEQFQRKLKNLKLQFRLCPGVALPTVKVVTKEYYQHQVKPYIEWDNFEQEERLESQLSYSCLPLRIIKVVRGFTKSIKETFYYFAPLGWEITRFHARVSGGQFKNATVTRSVVKGNQAAVEVELQYSSFVPAFCTVVLEGLISRTRMMDVDVPKTKTCLVIEDERGEHELPESLLDDFL